MTTAGAEAGGAAPQGQTPRLSPGALLAGRFAVEAFVGTQAAYELYRAVDRAGGAGGDRPVWLKLLHRELLRDFGARGRLEQDVAIAGQLDHKNIAAIYGLFTDGEATFVAAEAIDGQSVTEMLEKKLVGGRAFTLKGAYNVVTHACNALEHAHGALVHGLLSGDTVLVNSAGRVKLVDLGFGRALPGQERLRGHLSPAALACLAPEVAGAPETADRRADVYSLGTLLFELLTGTIPAKIFERPSALVPGLPPALDAVLERCLRPNPAERFAGCGELKLAVHAACEPALGTQSGQVPAVSATPPAPPSPGRTTAPPPPPPTAKGKTAPPPSPRPSAPRAATPAGGFAPRISQPRVPVSFNLDSALSAVDEAHERWLIQKDRLDFGPFRLAEVKHQIEAGQILGDHTIVDMENGERRRVKEHPLLRDLVRDIETRREATRQIEIAEMEARAHRRRIVTVLGVIAAVLLVGLPITGWVLWKRGVFEQKIVYRDRNVSTGEELHVEFSPMKVDPPQKRGHRTGPARAGGPKGGDDFDDVTNFGDATEAGGDETLSQEVVQSVMQRNYTVLKGCILEEKHRNPSLQTVNMEFIIRGTGQVSKVRVNGQMGTPFQSCMLGKMQSVVFPKFNGSRTHASFSLAFK